MAETPIDLVALEFELGFYNCEDREYLLDGFQNGFSLHYEGPRVASEAKNLKSALEFPRIVQDKINKEILAGRVAGPFQECPISSLRISPIGLVPKKTPGEYRLIHHLSYPHGFSVNDFIDPQICSVQYTSFDEAVFLMQDLGSNCKLFKMDLKNAFRLLPVNRNDFELLGFKFNGKYYVEKSLPFGCSISCRTFERFATFLEFAVKRRIDSDARLLHYLDDYLGGHKSYAGCQELMLTFQACLHELSVPLAEEKTEGPTEVLCFLGLELDSVNMVVRIPGEKLLEVVQKIEMVLVKEKVTLKKMQSLIGSLNFCCRAIIPGRPFCRRLINSICGLTKPHHHLRVNKSIRADLKMWLQFFKSHNGISAFHDRFWVSNEDVELFTDSAAGSDLGFGIYFRGRWASGIWPESWRKKGLTDNITVLELFPILVSLHLWGQSLLNKKIKFNCDNMAVVQIINSMTSKSEHVMCLLRHLTMKCLELNIVVRSSHIEGARNNICDSLSRQLFHQFRQLAPDADPEPTPIPGYLWNVFEEEPGLCCSPV
ncbi:MAG: reverse transcriptase domain-containing protein [Candidatus Thiodiazotropha sp.]